MANDFEIKLNLKAMQKIVKQEMTKKAKEYQSAADDILRKYNGRSVPTVRAAIKRHRAFRDSPLNESDIHAMAEAIASGTRVQFSVR